MRKAQRSWRSTTRLRGQERSMRFSVPAAGEEMQLGLSLLENLQSAESAAILARYAVFAPWETVGKRAAQALRSQRKQDYVPMLLPGMQSPVYSRAEVYQEPGSGQTYYRQIFFREGEERDVAIVDTNPNAARHVANQRRRATAFVLINRARAWASHERCGEQCLGRQSHGRFHARVAAGSANSSRERCCDKQYGEWRCKRLGRSRTADHHARWKASGILGEE